ncbi:MAG: nucleotidyltransferase domain-containing protein [Aeropyrum sp.]|nr:nucleotidyltransferase domain-containing protein [Aeropyrum sp.]MCE4615684.1 nucleotidyltransferase domain-containing protein [Aeropyrum sp.]
MKFVRIPERRIEEWWKGLETARRYSLKLKEALGRVSVLLHGSYARGDFNLWSDIDLIVVSERFEGLRPLDRYELLPDYPPRVEPLLVTPQEFEEMLGKPAWRQALDRGVILVVDEHGIAVRLREAGLRRVYGLEEVIEKLREIRGGLRSG